jgi:chromosome partitioning protein
MSKRGAFSVINYKGGTGKTCTLVNLAHALSLKGHRILIIDTDPQGSVAYHLGVTPTKTLYNIIVQNERPEDCLMTPRKNIDLIAANEHLFPAENALHQQPKREHVLSHKLHPLMAHYDYTFIDCSPSINLMNQNAQLCAPHLLVPVSMDYMTLLGVKQLIKNAKLLNHHFNATISVSKIIPTFYNSRNRKTKHVHESLTRAFSNHMATPIRTNVSISEAAGYGKSIFEYAPTGTAADDFNQLSKEVLNL